MEAEQQSVRSWITDGIIIAGLTATAYFWALFYEVGFCSYFSIPYYFISLSSVNVLIISGPIFLIPGALCIFLILVGALQPFVAYLGTRLSRFAKRSLKNSVITRFSLFFMLIGIIVYFSSFAEVLVRAIIRIIAVMIVIAFIAYPLVYHWREKGSYWDKVILAEVPRKRIRTLTLLPVPRFGDIINFVLIAIFTILIVLASSFPRRVGKEEAQSKKDFQVIAQSSSVPEVVVLRVYGDYLFASPFNRSTKEVEKKLFILKLSDMAKTPLTTEKIGPLQVKP